ncbi:MAG: hypothetical protein KGQ68_07375 [Gammaproteobacteria bacterium]|nr:hypothetical protein [Gammaproteobacteria bacterium]
MYRMQWTVISAALVVAAGLTAGCGQSTPDQSHAHAHSPAALLTADPQWIPDPGVVALVKTSSLNDCTQRTVEQQVDSYLAAPRWEAGADSAGRDFVNVSGIVTYGGKPATALFQFLIDKDKRGFKYRAFAINGVLQPAYVAGMTLKEMCGSAMRSPLKIIKLPQAVTH